MNNKETYTGSLSGKTLRKLLRKLDSGISPLDIISLDLACKVTFFILAYFKVNYYLFLTKVLLATFSFLSHQILCFMEPKQRGWVACELSNEIKLVRTDSPSVEKLRPEQIYLQKLKIVASKIFCTKILKQQQTDSNRIPEILLYFNFIKYVCNARKCINGNQ